jgi:hypothetical protein
VVRGDQLYLERVLVVVEGLVVFLERVLAVVEGLVVFLFSGLFHRQRSRLCLLYLFLNRVAAVLFLSAEQWLCPVNT